MRRIPHHVSTTLACGLVIIFASQVRAQPDQLLLESPGGGLAVTRPTHATNLQYAGINFELLESLKVHDPFEITLFGDRHIAIVDDVFPQVEGKTVRGHFDQQANSFFTITLVEDAVAGSFFLPGGNGMIRLRYGGPNGLHYLHEVQLGPNDHCAGHELNMFKPGVNINKLLTQIDKQLAQLDKHQGKNQPPPNPLLGVCNGTDTTFDIMLVYSDDARIAAGGTSAIRAECINAVEVTEITYLTCLSLTIRTIIVGLAEVSYDESDRSYQDHLDALIDPDDGILDSLHATRDEIDADFLSLVVADSEAGGLGRCFSDEDDAMSVCNWTVVADNFTLAHEIGHNIGCGHDPVTGDNCGFENGWGHFFFVPSENAWRHTVMSYEQNESTRIPYYSHPDCQYEGVPTGTPTRDNTSVIFVRQYDCEAFRLTRMDVWVDFNYGGSENGSVSQPFNTLIEGVNRTLVVPVADIPILHIKPGSRNEAVTINKPMIIEACGGIVTIGQ